LCISPKLGFFTQVCIKVLAYLLSILGSRSHSYPIGKRVDVPIVILVILINYIAVTSVLEHVRVEEANISWFSAEIPVIIVVVLSL